MPRAQVSRTKRHLMDLANRFRGTGNILVVMYNNDAVLSEPHVHLQYIAAERKRQLVRLDRVLGREISEALHQRSEARKVYERDCMKNESTPGAAVR